MNKRFAERFAVQFDGRTYNSRFLRALPHRALTPAERELVRRRTLHPTRGNRRTRRALRVDDPVQIQQIERLARTVVRELRHAVRRHPLSARMQRLCADALEMYGVMNFRDNGHVATFVADWLARQGHGVHQRRSVAGLPRQRVLENAIQDVLGSDQGLEALVADATIPDLHRMVYVVRALTKDDLVRLFRDVHNEWHRNARIEDEFDMPQTP